MKDYTKYKNLYLLCFTDDTPEDAELLFKNVLSKAKLVCEYDNAENPISMLFLMDANIISNGKELPYYYLYAACTHPEHRGKGIMGRLLEKAKEVALNNGKLGIFLKPAKPSLFDFYAKSDFVPFFNVCKIIKSVNEFIRLYSPQITNTTKTTMSLWHSIRKDFLNEFNCDYVDFSQDILTTAADGSIPISSKNFGFVYEIRDNLLLVKEALCKRGYINQLMSAISHILQNSHCENVEIRLHPLLKDELTSFSEANVPFSVMWQPSVATNQCNTNRYHGFAFD